VDKSPARGALRSSALERSLFNYAPLARFPPITADETRQRLPSRYGAICIARVMASLASGKCRSAGLGTTSNMPYRRTPVLVSPRRSEPTHSAINVSPQPRYESKRGASGGGEGGGVNGAARSRELKARCHIIIVLWRASPKPAALTKNERCHAGDYYASTTSRHREDDVVRRDADVHLRRRRRRLACSDTWPRTMEDWKIGAGRSERY